MGLERGVEFERTPDCGGDMKLTDAVMAEYTDTSGVKHKVLVTPEDQDVVRGVPLLDLGGLGLPKDIEIELLKGLESVGITQYSDVLKPGGAELVATALRAALRTSVHDIVSLCNQEQKLLEEAGYASR